MQPRRESFKKDGNKPGTGFGAGVLIGLSLVTPVFAASSTEPFSTYEILLLVLAAILFVGIALEAIVNGQRNGHDPDRSSNEGWYPDKRHDDAAPDGPLNCMRWLP